MTQTTCDLITLRKSQKLIKKNFDQVESRHGKMG